MLAPAGAVLAKRLAMRGTNLVMYSSRVMALGATLPAGGVCDARSGLVCVCVWEMGGQGRI